MELASRILIEHALAWKLGFSALVESIYVLPGNSGTASVKKCSNISGTWNTQDAIVSFAQKTGITLFIPTMEQWLVNGIADAFTNGKLAKLQPFFSPTAYFSAGISCFGPSQDAVQLEGSKTFSKHFMSRHGIPTALYRTFNSFCHAG